MTYIPDFETAKAIVDANPAFTHTTEIVDGFRLHNFGYRLPGYMDFEQPIAGRPEVKAHELRGITFLQTGDTFQHFLLLNKFHCLNQTKGSMYGDVKGKTIRSITDKRDGSLIRFFILPSGTLVAKSKGSFSGPHCDMAKELVFSHPSLLGFILWCQRNGIAAIFELTGPDNHVVLRYETPALTLIQARDEATGDYLDIHDANEPVGQRVVQESIPVVENCQGASLDDLMAWQKTAKGVEGRVVQFSDGQMVKVKTDWYEDMHRHFMEKQRGPRMYVEMVLRETMDDALAGMDADDPERAVMEDIMIRVSRLFNATVADVLAVYRTFHGDPKNKGDKAAWASTHLGSPNFAHYMFAINNPDDLRITEFIRTSFLKSCKNDKDAEKFVNALEA